MFLPAIPSDGAGQDLRRALAGSLLFSLAVSCTSCGAETAGRSSLSAEQRCIHRLSAGVNAAYGMAVEPPLAPTPATLCRWWKQQGKLSADGTVTGLDPARIAACERRYAHAATSGPSDGGGAGATFEESYGLPANCRAYEEMGALRSDGQFVPTHAALR